MPLPAPTGAISMSGVVAGAPGGNIAILKGVSLTLEAGESLGIIGPSGSGKSTLARVLLGVWPVSQGVVRLDGADLSLLDPDQLGPHIGYVPQSLDLAPGTIAENIRRFGADDPEAVVAAAIEAGAHQMILTQPKGYDTVVGGPGFALSAGQKQRIGLARALYGTPALLALDEPDTGLDRDGELALAKAIEGLRARKATVLVVAHRPSMITGLDKVLVLAEGRVQKFGPAAEILPHVVPATARRMPA